MPVEKYILLIILSLSTLTYVTMSCELSNSSTSSLICHSLHSFQNFNVTSVNSVQKISRITHLTITNYFPEAFPENQFHTLRKVKLMSLILDKSLENPIIPWNLFVWQPLMDSTHDYSYRTHSLQQLNIIGSISCFPENQWLFEAKTLEKYDFTNMLDWIGNKDSPFLFKFNPWKFLLLPQKVNLDGAIENCGRSNIQKEKLIFEYIGNTSSIHEKGDNIRVQCRIESDSDEFNLIIVHHSFTKMKMDSMKYNTNHSKGSVELFMENVTVADNMWLSCEIGPSKYTLMPLVKPLPIVISGAPEFIGSENRSIDENFHWCNFKFKAFPIPSEENITLYHDDVEHNASTHKDTKLHHQTVHFTTSTAIGSIGDELFDHAYFSASIEVRRRVGAQGWYFVSACNIYGCGRGQCFVHWDQTPPVTPSHNLFGKTHINSRGSSWGALKLVLMFICILLIIIVVVIGGKLIHIQWLHKKKKSNPPNGNIAIEMDCIEMTAPPNNLHIGLINNGNYSPYAPSAIPQGFLFDLTPDSSQKVFAIPDNMNIFDADCLKMEGELGEGAFGTVFLVRHTPSMINQEEKDTTTNGDLQRSVSMTIPNEEKEMLMAAKKLTISSKDQMTNLHHEAGNLVRLHHPNIVAFFGMSLLCQSETVFLLFEFMPGGDLRTFLQERAPDKLLCTPSLCEPPELPSPSADSSAPLITNLQSTAQEKYPDPGEFARNMQPTQLSIFHLMSMSEQVATGLTYLAQNRVVHRDLAARNCLVNDGLRVKISDFGMSRDLYCEAYYRSEGSKLVPVRWLPPESLAFGRFTSMSDVFSLGVVLWEMFSYGQLPWCGLSNKEVIKEVKNGSILEQPVMCPHVIYECIVKCWEFNPDERPTASNVMAYLNKLNSEPQ